MPPAREELPHKTCSIIIIIVVVIVLEYGSQNCGAATFSAYDVRMDDTKNQYNAGSQFIFHKFGRAAIGTNNE